ncbi:MAG: DUF1294 domain-containing protein [Clostridia bacterium]|nr:DUF1294 domain-containing protein [Clostridia bacterium]
MSHITYAFCAIVAAISLVTFALYGIDKYKAKRGLWRIPERVLLMLSALGGGIGGLAAMSLFRHKTRHIYFIFTNILGIILSAAAIAASLLI